LEQTAVLGLLEQTAANKEGSAWLEELRGDMGRLTSEWQNYFVLAKLAIADMHSCVLLCKHTGAPEPQRDPS
jgi:hypothetical protein